MGTSNKNSQFELPIGEDTRVVSLFSGCGGLDLGFMGGFKFRKNKFVKNNVNIVFANDFDQDACRIYNKNSHYFGNHSISHRDICEIDAKNVPEFDVLLAGFPCQPFSNAGHREGIEDRKGRGTLFEQCERILSYAVKNNRVKPSALVFENVRGIISTKMPDKKTLVTEEICQRMSALGYKTTFRLLRLSDYGVPQNRYRVFFVGVLESKFNSFDFESLDKVCIEYQLPSIKQSKEYELLLGSVLSDLPLKAPQLNDFWHYSPTTQKMVDKIGKCLFNQDLLRSFKKKKSIKNMPEGITQGRSWKNINPEELTPRFKKIHDDPVKYRAPNFYRRFALGEINGTITASAQPENCGITHPGENRRFTLRECARIQSFPDDFDFQCNHASQGYKVIGNAVPPVFGWVLARALLRHLKNI